MVQTNWEKSFPFTPEFPFVHHPLRPGLAATDTKKPGFPRKPGCLYQHDKRRICAATCSAIRSTTAGRWLNAFLDIGFEHTKNLLMALHRHRKRRQ